MPFRIHAQRKGIILHSKECSKLSHTELVELLVEFTFIAAVGDVDLKMCGRRVSTSLGQWIYCLLRGRSCRQVHREDLIPTSLLSQPKRYISCKTDYYIRLWLG